MVVDEIKHIVMQIPLWKDSKEYLNWQLAVFVDFSL